MGTCYAMRTWIFQKQGVDLTSPILVLDSNQFAVVNKQLGKDVTAGEPIFSVVRK